MEFDKEDVDRLDQALARFVEFRGNRGYPDWTQGAALYEPILSFLLLRAQRRIEWLTWSVLLLTAVLVVLALLGEV